MSSREIVTHQAPVPVRTGLEALAGGRARVLIDGRPYGPAVARRTAMSIVRWLESGALADLESPGASKLERAFSSVDQAIDTVGDLLRNGLR